MGSSSLLASTMAAALAFLTIIIVVSVACYLCNRALPFPAPRATPIGDPDRPPQQAGLDKAALLRYPKQLYSEAKRKESGSCCSICLADYKDTDTVRLLADCDHMFHQHCVDPWLLRHASCPLCRNNPAPPNLSTVVLI